MCVARYSTPPAGTVFAAQPVCTPDELSTGLQHPTWIVPGVVGSRWPWKSLIASSWTLVSLSFGPLPLSFGLSAASACEAPSTSTSPSAARTAMSRLMYVVSPFDSPEGPGVPGTAGS
jgi:hypothetical protein